MSLYITQCKDCIFNYGNMEPKLDVVECHKGRHEIYKSRGQVTEDGMSIKGLCTICRDETWENKYEDINEQLYKELTNVYTLVIFDDEWGDVLKRLQDSLREPQTIKPTKILIVYTANYPLSELNKWMREYVSGKDIPFTIMKIEESDYPREPLDLILPQAVGMFYVVCQAGYPINHNTFYTLYYYFEQMLEKVLVVKNKPSRFEKDYHGLACSILYHKRVKGNKDGNIEDKAAGEDLEWALKEWTELYLACDKHKGAANGE